MSREQLILIPNPEILNSARKPEDRGIVKGKVQSRRERLGHHQARLQGVRYVESRLAGESLIRREARSSYKRHNQREKI